MGPLGVPTPAVGLGQSLTVHTAAHISAGIFGGVFTLYRIVNNAHIAAPLLFAAQQWLILESPTGCSASYDAAIGGAGLPIGYWQHTGAASLLPLARLGSGVDVCARATAHCGIR